MGRKHNCESSSSFIPLLWGQCLKTGTATSPTAGVRLSASRASAHGLLSPPAHPQFLSSGVALVLSTILSAGRGLDIHG